MGPTAPQFFDTRLAGGGLAALADILTNALPSSSTVKVIAREAGMSPGDIEGDTVRDQWSDVIARAGRQRDGVRALLDTIRPRLGELDAELINDWEARGQRRERLTDAYRDVRLGAASLAVHDDPRQLRTVLSSIRSATLDLTEGLTDPTVSGPFLLGADTQSIEAARTLCLAAVRRVRTAADVLTADLRRAVTLGAKRPRGLPPDVVFAQERSMDQAMFDDREVLEEALADLHAHFRAYAPELSRQPSAGA